MQLEEQDELIEAIRAADTWMTAACQSLVHQVDTAAWFEEQITKFALEDGTGTLPRDAAQAAAGHPRGRRALPATKQSAGAAPGRDRAVTAAAPSSPV